jgi:hypothetical protein
MHVFCAKAIGQHQKDRGIEKHTNHMLYTEMKCLNRLF